MNKPKILQILPMWHKDAEQYLYDNAEVIRTDDYSEENITQLVKEVDGIVLRNPAKITPNIMDANPNLKAISASGVGVDNIDVTYASEKGIPVLNAPSVNAVSTAEHAVMLLMALSKSLVSCNEEMKKGNYDFRSKSRSIELKGKKVGLIGFGTIAQEVAKRLSIGFDMEVTAWVRKVDSEKHVKPAEKLGIQLTTNQEVIFSQSDFISLHIPLIEETKYSINHSLLSLMKPTAFLINTARGAVVEKDSLYQLLKEKKIAGAAIDVFDPEPPEKDDPLLLLPNVIATPHVGGVTEECNYITAMTVAKNLIKAVYGEKPEFIVNKKSIHDFS
ncbi:hydroxyacid dehydrogenase [Bacillus sp. 03113]|uniref:hydroxyacid dehydrogenase n=1 Tax=Bacillus sp. 03113 TaxID=2578211 RepID=UPI0011419CA1|nr:hydroxyacid dehydrogenase [Bacillus sp. 03113]